MVTCELVSRPWDSRDVPPRSPLNPVASSMGSRLTVSQYTQVHPHPATPTVTPHSTLVCGTLGLRCQVLKDNTGCLNAPRPLVAEPGFSTFTYSTSTTTTMAMTATPNGLTYLPLPVSPSEHYTPTIGLGSLIAYRRQRHDNVDHPLQTVAPSASPPLPCLCARGIHSHVPLHHLSAQVFQELLPHFT